MPEIDIGQRNGLIQRQAEIEHADKRFGDMHDDTLAARRTKGKNRPAIAVKHDRGRHGRQRPLATHHAVGHRRAVLFGREGEIGELVIQEETACNQLAAEDALDSGRHIGNITLCIDGRKMRGDRNLA